MAVAVEYAALSGWDAQERTDGAIAWVGRDASIKSSRCLLDMPHVAVTQTFIMLCCRKFASKRADPGATVGAYGAQSIGEPGTQMTLKVRRHQKECCIPLRDVGPLNAHETAVSVWQAGPPEAR